MEIIWYGHASFRLKDRNSTVVTDPYDDSLGLVLPRPKADIVTISQDTSRHNYVKGVKGEFQVVDGPGEYEIGGTFVTGIRTWPSKKGEGIVNNIFVIYMENLSICHLGNLSHVPTQSQVEDLGNIDILLAPVGGQSALNAAQAAEVISLIEPYLVIPMHYSVPGLHSDLEAADKFLKELGMAKAKTVSTLKITKSTLPEETHVVLLEMRTGLKESSGR